MRLLLTASAAATALLLAAPALAQDMGPPSGDPYADQGYAGGDEQYDPNDPSAYGGLPPGEDYGDSGAYADQPGPYPDQDYGSGGYDPNDPNAMPPNESYEDQGPTSGYGDEPYGPGPSDDYADPNDDGSMGNGGYADDGGAGAPAGDDLGDREAQIEARIHAAAESGRLNPDLANNALVELESIRTQHAELLRRDRQLTDTTRGFIEDRLDVLEGRLEAQGGA
ncbi:MAG TPA: hypothetical protein VF559_01885 [Caulobacteraceae bacterium]|jgi:hypothetical protein